MPHLYTARFETYAKVIRPEDSDRFVAKASLQPLRSLLPPTVDLSNSDDVLYFAAAGANVGMGNLNGDALTPETALAIYKSAIHRYLNTDHNRSQICGAVINSGLTRYGTNEPLSPEEAAALREPFNMSIAGVIWKTIAGQLTRYLVRVGDELSDSAMSLSWELAFSSYNLALAPSGTRNIFDARIVTASDPDFTGLSKKLRANGGKGKTDDGEDVFRVITGDAIILGYAIVSRPAADVKGILPITDSAPVVAPAPTPEPPVEAAVIALVETVENNAPTLTQETPPTLTQATPSIAAQEENFITAAKTRVTPNTPIPMKIESLDQLSSQWSEIRKMESAAAVTDLLQDAIQKGNADWEQKIAAEKNTVTSLQQSKAEIEQAKAAAEKRATELEASLAAVQKQVDELKAAQASAEATQKFQERMASLDEQFDLDNEDRELLAPEVRACADDAAFAAYAKKQSKLMAGKKKGCAKAPPFMKKDEEKEEKMEKKEDCKASVAAVTEPVVDVKEALASVTATAEDTVILNGISKVDATLKDQMDEAFGETIKIDGKSVKTRRAEKLAKEPKE